MECSEKAYSKTIHWVYGLKRHGMRFDLKTMRQLLKLMGNPEKDFRIILVSGTNGKGSSARMISSILQKSGYKIGVYTSPHLSDYEERIVINRSEISKMAVIRAVDELRPVLKELQKLGHRHPTFFELTTAIALKYFSDNCVDFAVLEVGMGGRLDATNATEPIISVITNVSIEHTEILGNTVKKIAREKAGIIRNNSFFVTATQDKELYKLFRKICKNKKTRMFCVGKDLRYVIKSADIHGQEFRVHGIFSDFNKLYIPFAGEHQVRNAATAIATIEALRFYDITIPQRAIADGLRGTLLPGRFEIIRKKPLIILDCAKDPDAAKNLKKTVLSGLKNKKILLVTSISSDKDLAGILDSLVPLSEFVIITRHGVMNRAADPKKIARFVKKYNKGFLITKNVRSAVKKALEKDDVILITGSVFTVGEARDVILGKDKKKYLNL